MFKVYKWHVNNIIKFDQLKGEKKEEISES